MKTFKQFQEAAFAAPAIAGASKYVIPLLLTGIGAAGTIMQASKKGDNIRIRSGKFGTDLRGRARITSRKDESKTADIAREKDLDLTDPRQRRRAASLANKRNKTNKTNKKINPKTALKKKDNSEVVIGPPESMSKSKKNTIDPETMINQYIEEMKLNLGPAKGKDFANVIGPYLVTPDELKHKEIKTPFGKKYDLEMRCYVNGDLISSGNTKDMS